MRADIQRGDRIEHGRVTVSYPLKGTVEIITDSGSKIEGREVCSYPLRD